MVAKDAPEIRRDMVAAEAARIPVLHDKYLKYKGAEVEELNRMQQEKAKLVLTKTQYYMGKADPEVYKEKPFRLKVLKGDLKVYLDADDDIQALDKSINRQQRIVDYLSVTLSEVGKRGYRLDNIIKDQRTKFGLDSMSMDVTVLTEDKLPELDDDEDDAIAL